MARGKPAPKEDGPIVAVLARFADPPSLVAACRRLRAEGYRDFEAHSPFPLHGLGEALGLGSSPVGWPVFVLGMGGAALGMLLQWWVSGVAYPLNVAGKPLFSWPAFVPVTFELGVLGGAVGALAGLLYFARLPRLHHRLFDSTSFEAVSDDAFFVSIVFADAELELAAATRLLVEMRAESVEVLQA